MFASNVRCGNESLFGYPFHNDSEIITSDINFAMGWDFGAPPANVSGLAAVVRAVAPTVYLGRCGRFPL
jgi:hypothetical protein